MYLHKVITFLWKKALFKLAATGQQITFCQFSYVFCFFFTKVCNIRQEDGWARTERKRKSESKSRGGGGKEAEGSYYLFIHCQFNCIICITVTNKYFLLPFCISALIFFLLLYLNYQAEMTKFCYILCEIDNILKTSPN